MILVPILLGENDDFLRNSNGMPNERQKPIKHIVPERFREDVNALTAYVGEDAFNPGLEIEVTLAEILDVLPRKRRRVDSYDALAKYLSDERGIILTIKTNRK